MSFGVFDIVEIDLDRPGLLSRVRTEQGYPLFLADRATVMGEIVAVNESTFLVRVKTGISVSGTCLTIDADMMFERGRVIGKRKE